MSIVVRNRVWLLMLFVGLLLVLLGVWSLVSNYPDFSVMRTAPGSLDLPVPTAAATP